MNTGPPRWVMHLDMDAFYAAAEQRDDPALWGRPVVVGAQSGGRGAVATCSYETRRFGIHSAMPINEAHRRCPDAVYLRPRMGHYLEVAQQIRAVMVAGAPVVEPISIDAAFLDVSGLEHLIGPPQTIGRRIKEAIRAAVGLTASVGIAPHRLVAKIASDFGKPNGLIVVPQEQVLDFLGGQPVGVLCGGAAIGPCPGSRGWDYAWSRTCAAGRSRNSRPSWGPRRHQPLPAGAGLASDRVGERAARHSLSKKTTFGVDVTDPGVLHDTLRALATEVAAAARQAGLAGHTVTLKIRFCGFETQTRQRRLDRRSDDPRTLLSAAWSPSAAGRWQGKPVRLIGLGIAALRPRSRSSRTGSTAAPRAPQITTGSGVLR
ncbi:DNA polymerase IV [uncultured Thiodictyon sp.]|uniref:DNA polymerase IV n=1 Tax=uncultured Thiodictyon sp. TaxID=1846217 RepID=UPI0025FDE3B3|nr:DNA polymerase IV [uncultured Thiodictyon sp.]